MATTILPASSCVSQYAMQPSISALAELSKETSQALDSLLAEAQKEYEIRNPNSAKLHLEAQDYLPGGNTRSVLHNDPFPLSMKRGEGNKLWDHDGHEYLDLVGELSAGLYGHSDPRIREALISTLETVGLSLGATTTVEVELAKLLCQRFSSIERVRFCNSGTEANLYNLSIARFATKKRKIIVFEGGYHGGVLSFGHGIAKNNVDPDDWILGNYNDIISTVDLIESRHDVAAVLVEAMQGAGGCIPAQPEFLQAIQESCKKAGIIFILDEVMTSRLYPGGLQAKYSLFPDLTSLGKYIGGGMAFGAFGGRRDLLAVYDPRIPSLAHSGTFNNNTLAMVSGYVGLSQIYLPEVNQRFNTFGDKFRGRLQQVARGTKMVVTGEGAVMTIHFMSRGTVPVRSTDIQRESIPKLKKLFWCFCLSRGFWITERGMLSLILSTTEDDLDRFVESVGLFIRDYHELLKL